MSNMFVPMMMETIAHYRAPAESLASLAVSGSTEPEHLNEAFDLLEMADDMLQVAKEAVEQEPRNPDFLSLLSATKAFRDDISSTITAFERNGERRG